MKLIIAATAALALIAGCAPEPRQTMTIDGHRMMVGREPGENVWMAMPAVTDAQNFTPGDNNIHLRSIRAIEAASGCKVIPTSIAHLTMTMTTAVVDCG